MSGGVGEAYPGSTGGEIFNYYGTDGLANTAEGSYCTTIGKNNKNHGEQCFVGGYGNTLAFTGTSGHCDNNLIFGNSNKMNCVDSTKTVRSSVILGYNNEFQNAAAASCTYMVGENLKHSKSNTVLLGRYNNSSTSLSSPNIILAAGSSNSVRKNAIEIDSSNCKILNKLQLATDSTTVNAITSPQDPNNVTTDDQTLATKSYVLSQIPSLNDYNKSSVLYSVDWATATALPLDNTTVSLTSYGTIPAWANRVSLIFKWENELFVKDIFLDANEGIHLYAVQRAYSTFPETIVYKHLRIEWNHTNQTLLVSDFWTYDQDMSNNGAISNWDHTLSNANDCKILNVVVFA